MGLNALATVLASTLEAFAHQAATVAVAGLWQGFAVALGIAICLKIAPRVSAAQRFTLWALGFVAVVALPLVPLIETRIGAGSEARAIGVSSWHTWLQLDSRWTLVIFACWLIASAARIIDLLMHAVRLRRLWLRAVPLETSVALPSTRDFEVCATADLDRPSVIGFFQPRVLIPDWLVARLTPGEFEQILLHEAEHLRRRDDWTNLFQKLCLVLFPLNPALCWIDRELSRHREMACDEAVVHVTQAPRAYAACLAGLAERGMAHRAEALSLGTWRHRSELGQRVHLILRRKQQMHPLAARVVVGTFACGLLVAAGELARCPKLIVFAPVGHPDIARATDPELFGDTVLPSNRRSKFAYGFLPTKAIMPSPARDPLPGGARADAAGLKRYQAQPRRATETASILSTKPQVQARKAKPRPSDSKDWQQVIVFTAWEKVETSTTAANQTATDYDAQATADNGRPAAKTEAPPAAGNREKGPGTSRITVTQLVFKVVPSTSKAGLKSAQRAAIPLGDGWFVVQL
jgi:Zn-dependent protease with chaperone function